MNIANKLTVSRILLTFVFMFFLFTHWPYGKVCAFLTFVLASYTDYLDGRIAKSRGLVSDFGKFMDPIADKVLLLAAFLAFVEMGLIPAWMVVIIILREFIVTGLRILGIVKGHIVAASRAGKHKTVSRMAAVSFILIYLLLKQYLAGSSLWAGKMDISLQRAIYVVMLITVSLSIISGASYLIKNRRLFT